MRLPVYRVEVLTNVFRDEAMSVDCYIQRSLQ